MVYNASDKFCRISSHHILARFYGIFNVLRFATEQRHPQSFSCETISYHNHLLSFSHNLKYKYKRWRKSRPRPTSPLPYHLSLTLNHIEVHTDDTVELKKRPSYVRSRLKNDTVELMKRPS